MRADRKALLLVGALGAAGAGVLWSIWDRTTPVLAAAWMGFVVYGCVVMLVLLALDIFRRAH